MDPTVERSVMGTVSNKVPLVRDEVFTTTRELATTAQTLWLGVELACMKLRTPRERRLPKRFMERG